MIPLCVKLALLTGCPGWRQAQHLKKRIKQQVREIARISASKSPQVTATLSEAYGVLLSRVAGLLERVDTAGTGSAAWLRRSDHSAEPAVTALVDVDDTGL